MECPCRWASLTLLIYMTLYDGNVWCQNILTDKSAILASQPYFGDSKREITQVSNPSLSKEQLLNALFSLVTSKRLKPDTSTVPQEQQQVTTIQNVPRTYNVVPLVSQLSLPPDNKPILINGAPGVPANPILNVVLSPGTSSYVPSLTTPQPVLLSEPVPQTIPPIAPQIALNNLVGVQPTRTVWQIAPPITAINTCPAVQSIEIPNVIAPPINLQISPPSLVLPAINTESGLLERVCETNFRTRIEEPQELTNDGKQGLPINLEINIPSPNDPGPRITFITAPPSAAPQVCEPPFGFPPQPPIIIKKSQSSLRTLLPILLLTMFNDRGCNGGCCCPCNCGCDSGSTIPIPYPIPIPTNNPIINTDNSSPFSCRKRNNKDNGN